MKVERVVEGGGASDVGVEWSGVERSITAEGLSLTTDSLSLFA